MAANKQGGIKKGKELEDAIFWGTFWVALKLSSYDIVDQNSQKLLQQ